MKTGTPFPHADNNVWARQQSAYAPPGPAPLILFFSRTVLGVESDLKNQRSSRKETLWSTGIAKNGLDKRTTVMGGWAVYVGALRMRL